MKFNINNYVKIKLTDRGREILEDNHNRLFWGNTAPQQYPYIEPEEDEDGYIKMSLWLVMQNFGDRIHMGHRLPFETEIIICHD